MNYLICQFDEEEADYPDEVSSYLICDLYVCTLSCKVCVIVMKK